MTKVRRIIIGNILAKKPQKYDYDYGFHAIGNAHNIHAIGNAHNITNSTLDFGGIRL